VNTRWVRAPGGAAADVGESVLYMQCHDLDCPSLPELRLKGATGHAHLYVQEPLNLPGETGIIGTAPVSVDALTQGLTDPMDLDKGTAP
jgi:hypothetical protein